MSNAMNSRQAQVVDPILSTQARGYSNAELVGTVLLPYADIPNRSMKVINFGKDAFRRYVDTRRAPGTPSKRLQFGYASDPVSLKQEALEALVPDEISQDASRVPGIDLATVSINQVQAIIALGREVEIATKVRDAATYAAGNKVTLAGSDQWSDPASTPKDDVKAAKEAVRAMIGLYPNTMVVGPAVFNALDDHPKLMEKFKYTSSESITTAMLARYFDVEQVVVGKAVSLAEDAADTAAADDVWGNDAVLAYVPRGGNFMVPAFGYTYRLIGYPLVEQPYYERPVKSWVYPVTEEFRPYVTGAEAGFLIKAAAAA